MNILAIDPAAKAGFAHSNGNHGVWDLSKTFDRHPGDRLVRFEQYIETAIAEWGCDLLAAEDATFGSHNPHTQSMHNELRGVIRLVGARRGIDVRLFNPKTIKACATGSGSAKKDQMMRACRHQLGIEPADDNEADALWILEVAKQPGCWIPTKKEKKTAKKRQQKKQPKLF